MLRVFLAVLGDAHALGIAPLAGLAGGAIIAHARALGEEQRDAPMGGLGHALHHRPVDLAGLAGAEDLAQIRRDLAGLGDQQNA